MSDALISASLVFRDDGTPYSPRHDDIYHSAAGALAQARHVFIDGNGLPGRWRGKACFTVIEAGFGMGINFLATWAAWRNDAHRATILNFVSIEKHPFSANDLRAAHAAIIDDDAVVPLADLLASAWPPLEAGMHRLAFDAGAVTLTLALGDAARLLPHLADSGAAADAIYLDGFAPAKNPDMWTPAIFTSLARIAKENATFATYTSAGDVKRALVQSGFEYRKVAGFGGKRAMLVGKRSLSGNAVIDS
ncbi:5-methylaminomethyl-2-thiouridine methyltransferase [Caballeronia arvi]|uniref:5-methylaminomethyl-2-thiouridine methyltransferase n=1 Tax=Caballeronia arvi TaxID=1777135 RepID=A0A158G3A8_9BURK|nr:5-methylaminomethyl-2-thiouridine methyltransferase [Caballeronia arvi]